jgi:hypothetical protein
MKEECGREKIKWSTQVPRMSSELRQEFRQVSNSQITRVPQVLTTSQQHRTSTFRDPQDCTAFALNLIVRFRRCERERSGTGWPRSFEEACCRLTEALLEAVMTIGQQDAPLPFNLTDLDRQILAQTDDEFQPHSWDELKQIIGKSIRVTRIRVASK